MKCWRLLLWTCKYFFLSDQGDREKGRNEKCEISYGIFWNLCIGIWIQMKDEVEPQHGIGLKKRERKRDETWEWEGK